MDNENGSINDQTKELQNEIDRNLLQISQYDTKIKSLKSQNDAVTNQIVETEQVIDQKRKEVLRL